MKLVIRQGGGVYCDYCNEVDKKCVNDGGDRDICFDCVLEIYQFAKTEIL